MNKRQLEKEVERLRAEMDKRDENLNTIKKIILWFLAMVMVVGLPLTFCVMGLCWQNNDLIISGVVYFSAILFLLISVIWIDSDWVF